MFLNIHQFIAVNICCSKYLNFDANNIPNITFSYSSFSHVASFKSNYFKWLEWEFLVKKKSLKRSISNSKWLYSVPCEVQQKHFQWKSIHSSFCFVEFHRSLLVLFLIHFFTLIFSPYMHLFNPFDWNAANERSHISLLSCVKHGIALMQTPNTKWYKLWLLLSAISYW